MNKKLLVVAVAGALAVPGIALAQVTISGKIGYAVQQISLSGANRLGNTSATHIYDNQSSLRFDVREDLGGGLAAFGRLETRPTINGGGGGLTNGTGAPPMWIGLESTSWGTLRGGVLSGLHYVTGPDYTGSTGTAYNSVQIITGSDATGVAMRMATRLRNAIAWDSLNYGGFKMTVAFSSNGAANQDADLGVAGRKGRTWNLIPQFIQKDWNIGYSYYDQKPDFGVAVPGVVPGAATAVGAGPDEKGSRFFGEYNFGNGFRLGGTYDKFKTTNSATGVKVTERNAYSLSGMYVTGPHQIAAHMAKAGNDKVLGANTGAKSFGVAYQYSLSKRTNAFVSYQKLTNQAAAAFGPGGMQTPTFASNGGVTLAAGEDLSSLMMGVNHSF
jgi:predicted porin